MEVDEIIKCINSPKETTRRIGISCLKSWIAGGCLSDEELVYVVGRVVLEDHEAYDIIQSAVWYDEKKTLSRL